MQLKNKAVSALSLLALIGAGHAKASTVAWWRFEEGAAGTQPGTQTNSILDSSGNNNTLTTYAAGTAPTYSTNVPGNPLNPAATNGLSFDFTPAPAGFSTRDLYVSGNSTDVNSHNYAQFTVEASVNFAEFNGGYQTFVGKDGVNYKGDGNGANAGVYFQSPDKGNTGGVQVFSFRTHQANGTFVICNGTTAIVPGQWYNVAAVSDGTTLSLYLQSAPNTPYHLENSVPFSGAMLVQGGATWTVGRGYYNNGVGDRTRGLIDEVRISDTALTPSQLLFAPPAAQGPAAPTNLTATGGASDILLTFNLSAGADTYTVKRSLTAGGPYTTLATGLLSAVYNDTSVVNGTKYYYVVTATNALGTSGNSNEASATSQAAQFGTGNGLLGSYYTSVQGNGPYNFNADTGTPFLTTVDPTINFNSGNGGVAFNPRAFDSGVPTANFTTAWTGTFQSPITGAVTLSFITDDGSQISVDTGSGLTVLATDTTTHGPTPSNVTLNLVAGQKYPIKLEYFQGGGGLTAQLAYSYVGQPLTIVPQSQLYANVTTAPSAPILSGGAGVGVINLAYTATTATSYTIKRSTTSGGPYTTVATGVTGQTYKDFAVQRGVTYYYVVVAVNAFGSSPNSNEVALATPTTYIPVAYWHFDEGTADTAVAAGATIPDSSGNNNTLITFLDDTAPTYRANNPGNPTTPAYTNKLSVDFGVPVVTAGDLREFNTFSAAGDINTHVFNQFTLEASINITNLAGYQTFLGKDGYQFTGDGNANNASLYFQKPDPGATGGVPVVSVRAHEGSDGQFIIVDGVTPLVTGQWYNVAAVADGATLSLYLQTTPGGAYNLENSVPFTGGLAIQNKPWSVGRGFYANGATDQFTGLEDEVRISDVALDPTLFLFAPPPGATVTGRVSLEGVPDLSAVSSHAPLGTFTVTFRDAASGAVVKTANVTLATTAGSANGTFIVSGVPAGSYNVLIKGSKNLAQSVNLTVSGSTGTVAFTNLPAGDSNNDNFVDSSDFGTLIGAFNTDGSIPGSGYDPTVDFNFDGLVDSSDFGLLIGEFNNAGAN